MVFVIMLGQNASNGVYRLSPSWYHFSAITEGWPTTASSGAPPTAVGNLRGRSCSRFVKKFEKFFAINRRACGRSPVGMTIPLKAVGCPSGLRRQLAP